MRSLPQDPDLEPVTELLLRDIRSAARKANHAEVARLLAECEAHWTRGAFYAEALSWAARAYLSKGHRGEAARFAGEAYALGEELLASSDADGNFGVQEGSLGTALGAAVEVQAQIASGDGRSEEAVHYLKEMEQRHQGRAFTARIRKNLLQLTLVGQAALPLNWTPLPGTREVDNPPELKATLLFFWAHWCSDSRAQGRTLSRFLESAAASGITLVAPTRLYGYITKGDQAGVDEETAHIGAVLEAEYPCFRQTPSTLVPFAEENTERYGVSTWPTLVFIDRSGTVRLYHPGAMKLEELEAAFVLLQD